MTGRASQRRQLALLAILGAAGERGCSRDKLIGYLWPDSSETQARHILADAVYLLRKALGEDAVLASADFLRLNRERVWTDVEAFDDALAAEDRSAAVEAYAGPFLDGFYLNGAREFEGWVDAERQRIARSLEKALETLAEEAATAGDHTGAVDWWGRLAAHDPLNSRIAVRLVEAMLAAGDPAHAIRLAQDHANLLEAELGIEPPPDFREVLGLLRATTGGRFADTKPYRAVARASDAVLYRAVEGSEERYSLADRFAVGREQGDLVLRGDPFLSSRHLEVRRQGSEYVLEDLGSLNGTFVGIQRETPLAEGDCIMVGSQILRLRDGLSGNGMQLVRIDGGTEVESYDLAAGRTGIGRSVGGVTFPDDGLMAEEHAEIRVRAGNVSPDGVGKEAIVTVECLAESGGVFLQINGETPLSGGDVFAAGQQVFRFERIAAADS